jgi:Cu+-exporting ATPase
MRNTLLGLAFLASFGAAGLLAGCGCNCGNHAPAASPANSAAAPSTSAPAAAGDVKKPGEAKVGDKTTCPVSGEEFVVTANSPTAEYDGKTYYFCCPGCDAKFKADPKKYLR